MLEAALAALAKSFYIFPVAPGAKVPHPASSYIDAAGQLHGWGETATNDPNRVIDFWTRVDPRANVGIACKPSQLLVIDLDKAKEDWGLMKTDWAYLHQGYGPRVDGDAVFDEMMFKAVGTLTDIRTYRVKTGSGGLHLYYRWPAHWPKISQASPVKGIVDVRGNGGQYGGYVLGEGSVSESGEYLLQGNYDITLPATWLRHLVAEKPRQAPQRRPQGIRQPGAISWSGLVQSVRHAGEGNRNNALLWAARSMYSDRAPLQEALDTLGPAAADAGLSQFETERTIRSGYNAQKNKEG